MLTSLQRQVLARVIVATEAGTWYRATASGDRSHNNGERVTLASLHYRGLCERRAWRGADGAANAAYEYRATARVIEVYREFQADQSTKEKAQP